MQKVIETNLSMNPNYSDTILDHQSRVIEVESWESYIEEILTGEAVYRYALHGSQMEGCSITLNGIIENFKSDEHHLSYELISDLGIDRNTAYLIE